MTSPAENESPTLHCQLTMLPCSIVGDKEGIGNGWAFRIMAEVRMFLVVSLSVAFNDLVIVLVADVLSMVKFVGGMKG